MLSQEELEKLLTDIESDRVERTTSPTVTKKFCEAICAFSNDLPDHREPGYLLVGVNDDGTPSGLEVTEQLLVNLANLRSDGNILPTPTMNVEKLEIEGDEIAVVEVIPSDQPPVRFKGVVRIRVGPRKGIASQSEERILAERRTARDLTFDASHCRGCGVEELDDAVFSLTYLREAIDADTLAENERSLKEQLASLRFFSLQHDCATHAGVLLFAKDVLGWLPGAYVQFVRYAGTGVTDAVENEYRFSGDLLSVLSEIDKFIPLQIQRRPEAVSVLREREVADYPLVGIRELLMNAVMHRNYDSSTAPIRFTWFSDRVEIQSPGGLYGEATPENFPVQTSYRNPVVAEAMKTLGYVNRFGRGVLAAQEALKKNGNPEAEFGFETTHFLATIRRRE